MGRRAFMLKMFELYGKPWVWGMAALLILSVIPALFVDIRFVILALMIVFIIIPMAGAFLYINYGFRRGCVINVVPHYLDIDEKGITVTVLRLVEKTDENTDTAPDTSDSSSEPEYEIAFSQHIGYADFGLPRLGLKSLTLPMKDGFVWIPDDCFTDDSTFAEAMKSVVK